MLTKQLDLNIDQQSWGRRVVPAWAKVPNPTTTIDVFRAMLMLGSLTTPNALSQASPERYWACIRYFTACAADRRLKINRSFLELDPHQKGILSDDFGVAISTYWLQQQLGGTRSIVDGRRFAINMGIRTTKGAQRLAKVGHRKCPDFVLEDSHGRFHVLECKGTQSGPAALARAMHMGHAQKLGIKVDRAYRGERLVIGLCLAGDGSKFPSELVVQDPPSTPITAIGKRDAQKADEIMRRLSMARALNLTGFPDTAFELAWPQDLRPDSPELEFLSGAERKAISIGRAPRQARVKRELESEIRTQRRRPETDYLTQEVRFDLPALQLDNGDVVTSVVMRRGLSRELLENFERDIPEIRAVAEQRVRDTGSGEIIRFTDTPHSTKMDYGGYFFSEAVFS